ncbi:MAG: acyltransferase [Thermotogaceae bacterium]|nr:acyltransferase [Thermotogaceae bacterium]
MSKLMKAIRNPRLAPKVLHNRIRSTLNKTTAKRSARRSGAKLDLGERISFQQKTLFTGKVRIKIGSSTSFGVDVGGKYFHNYCEIQARFKESLIIIGENVASNNGLLIISAERIEIGNDCLIGKDVQMIDFDAHGLAPSERRNSIGKVKPIVIGRNVWIGNNAIILKGTEIGDNSVIGAGAVITGGKFPSNVVIAGNPARILKELPNGR